MHSTHAPPWLVEARRHIGARHMHGLPDLSWRSRLWQQLLALVGQSSWALSSGMVATCLRRSDYPAPRNWISPSAWAHWGEPCGLALGAVVLTRSGSDPRVSLLVGITPEGEHLVLGAPEGGTIGISVLRREELVDCRWPPGAAAGVAAPQL